MRGEIKATALPVLVKALEKACQTKARLIPGGPAKIKKVGIVSGGGWSMLPDAIALGLDLFVTGTVDEPAQELCREGHISCVALGHYNSEKMGIQALMQLVQKQFGVQTVFIDIKNAI